MVSKFKKYAIIKGDFSVIPWYTDKRLSKEGINKLKAADPSISSVIYMGTCKCEFDPENIRELTTIDKED